MFDNLSNKLDKALKTLKGQGRISEINVATTIKEIRRALVDADVNFKVAKEVTDKVKKEALGQNVLLSVTPGQLLTKIVADELASLMGGEKQDINIKGNPSVILIAGLQGSGKTTFASKLAHFLKKQNKNVMLAACDVYRPAAIDQLHVLGEQIDVDVFSNKEENKPVKIALEALNQAKNNNKSVLIVDTAGRLAIDEDMMIEIEELKSKLSPSETLFVVDSMTGQDAVNTAKTFNERLDFDGVVLTKLDGDARGGSALSIRRVVDKPIKFISTGEKMDAIDYFYPDRMADRILGMGDVISLVERAQQVFDEDEAKKLNKKIRKNQFNLEDFLQQIQQIKKMGNVKDLMGMIPGMNKVMKNTDIDENVYKQVESIIFSMTIKERQNPNIIDNSRKKRIARGSGTTLPEVNKLLKQFESMRKMMKQMNTKSGMSMLSNMIGK